MVADFLGWPECEVCGDVIGPSDGALEVDEAAALDRHFADIESQVRSTGAPVEFNATPLGPDHAGSHWRWTHLRCDPDSNFTYWIAAERLDSYPKVLGWMWHLSEKGWLDSTDWYEAISRVWTIDRSA